MLLSSGSHVDLARLRRIQCEVLDGLLCVPHQRERVSVPPAAIRKILRPERMWTSTRDHLLPRRFLSSRRLQPGETNQLTATNFSQKKFTLCVNIRASQILDSPKVFVPPSASHVAELARSRNPTSKQTGQEKSSSKTRTHTEHQTV